MAIIVPTTAVWSGPAGADPFGTPLIPGNLLVSTSVYQDDPGITAGVTQLPTGCPNAGGSCSTAVTSGDYPYVFNNDSVDGSFGVTSNILMDELTPYGFKLGSIEIPNSAQPWVGSRDDQMVTSFSSKSELGLTLSPDGKYVTFMGYNAPVGAVDVSNSNTPGAPDPTNPVGESVYRVVARLGQDGRLNFTETNAYSGNNGRNAIYNDAPGADLYYTAGNAGNGANPEPQGVVEGAGAQIVSESDAPEAAQNPGAPTPVGSFNVMQQLGFPKEKIAKDNNYRGLAEYNNVLYYTKGSGSNGVDTVYFLDTTGKACLPGGVGLPVPGAPLPTSSSLTFNANESSTANPGLQPQNMCILKGFPTMSAKNANDSTNYPFGMFFANPTTLYVADEGSGDNTFSTTTDGPQGEYTAAAASTTAGLEKWIFNATTQSWQPAYTLQNGLNLGQPYDVPGYPTGLNSGPGGTGGPWSPATDGLRNLAGRVNADGTISLWAITSTVSGSGDQGADPNQLVNITDTLGATTLPAHESFVTLQGPRDRTVYRGVSLTPGTDLTPHPGCGLFCHFLSQRQP
ncbi:MAG TPA: hypothetical protein VIX84_19185 [Acidimicrobiales bacterium]